MPFEIHWEPRGACKRFHGFVTMDDLLHSVHCVEGDCRFDDVRYVINDFLAIEGHDVSETQVRMLAAIDNGAAHTNPNIRIAVVTDRDEVRMLARVYAAPPLGPYPTAVFSSMDEARRWVHAPGRPVHPRMRLP